MTQKLLAHRIASETLTTQFPNVVKTVGPNHQGRSHQLTVSGKGLSGRVIWAGYLGEGR